MDSVTGWTGRLACALQEALRMTNEAFAGHLGIAVRTVASWHQKPDMRQSSEMQQVLDTTLEQASPSVKARFAALVAQERPDLERTVASGRPRDEGTTDAERRLSTDPHIGKALLRLDQSAHWEPGTSRSEVASRLAQLDVAALHARGTRRSGVSQRRIAQALGAYYGPRTGNHGRYFAQYGSDTELETSVLTSADWLDLDCPLTVAHDRLRVTNTSADLDIPLDQDAAERAAQRLAETLALGIRLVDMPLYRLTGINISHQMISGSVGIANFVEYAVSMDLLEAELIDALAAGSPVTNGAMPLRDRHLPDLATVLDVSGRLCAGGPLALCAVARPASPYRGDADYLLLVQERSGHVLNAARRLAVIPKGFHQPMTDLRADAQIGGTLRREMEEELFGRDEIDNTVSDTRSADPMHPNRLTEPMRWLMDGGPDRLRMECTGFGLNLVSGNFEFASLIVIDDENFWSRYGDQVAANWESEGLHQYSSLDGELLAELAHDVAWSNEGLFALLQGLRRLRQIGGDRVNLPAIEWEVR